MEESRRAAAQDAGDSLIDNLTDMLHTVLNKRGLGNSLELLINWG